MILEHAVLPVAPGHMNGASHGASHGVVASNLQATTTCAIDDRCAVVTVGAWATSTPGSHIPTSPRGRSSNAADPHTLAEL